MASSPRVSIGMPVLNAKATIGRALRSLVEQSYENIEIIVCDNASDDGTPDLAEEYQLIDPRVCLHRFSERVDILASFRRPLEIAKGEFFMFAPADDIWQPDFVDENLGALDLDESLIGSCSLVAFTKNGRFNYLSIGAQSLRFGPKQNLWSLVAEPGDNARVFSLFRRHALDNVIPEKWYPAWDYQMTAKIVARGKLGCVNKILMERDTTPVEKYMDEYDRFFGARFMRWFPHFPAALAIWSDAMENRSAALAWNLLVWIMRSHVTYSKVQGGMWGGLASSLAKNVRLPQWSFGYGPLKRQAKKMDLERRTMLRCPILRKIDA